MSKPIDVRNLSLSLATKLGSMVVHADEFMSAGGHDFDRVAFLDVLRDDEVQEWIRNMKALAFLPEKRAVTLRNTPLDMAVKSVREKDRREVERRAAKRGVTTRHDDAAYVPKRVRRGAK